MKRTKLIALTALVPLAGCVTYSSIQPFGKDTYMMPTDVLLSYNVKLANEYCGKRGLTMQPGSVDEQAFVFRCVAAKDAQPTTWRPDGNDVNVTVKNVK